MDQLPTLLAALIGALAGGIGAEWLRHRLQGRTAAEQAKRDVAQRHLILLQDALESFYFRLDNLAEQETDTGRSDYYQLSSVYALGNLLAHKRRLMLDGVYALLNAVPRLASELEARLENIEAAIGRESAEGVSFYRYERLALGEYLLTYEPGWRVLTYAEFLAKRGEEAFPEIVDPARRFLARITDTEMRDLQGRVGSALDLVAGQTAIPAGAGREPVTGSG